MSHIPALIFWLAAIPFCIGFLPSALLPKKRRSFTFTLLSGYIVMWAVFELITLPAVILIEYDNFLFVLKWFMAAAILLAAAGLIVRYMEWRKYKEPWLGTANCNPLKLSLEAKAEWLLCLALIGFQLYMSVTRTFFDGDDAYYVVQSLMAQQSNAMYKNLPYTGISTTLDARHALAAFPVWIAFVAVKADIHSTIVSHVVMPLVLIPLGYLVYYEAAKAVFKDKKENIPVFMIIMALFQLFGNVSIYTNETFFLTRTWQGKAVAAGFVIPMAFVLLLRLFDDEKQENQSRAGLWLILVCLNITAGLCSSLAVFLMVILLAAAAFCFIIVKRSLKLPLKMGLACIPNLIYVALYLGLSG